MNNITPETFLNTLFPSDMRGSDRVIVTYASDRGWSNKAWPSPRGGRRAIPVGTRASYFCVSTVTPASATLPVPKRRREDVSEAWVVVCDDVGTKAAIPPVAPSYIIETSADNFQYGYLIEPFDVSTAAGRRAYDTVLYSLVKAGYNDPGCRSATRVVRLPGSLHSTGFVARLTHWSPSRSWELVDLLPAMGVEEVSSDMVEGDIMPGKHHALADVTDPVYLWLLEHKHIIGYNERWVHIQCPWRDAHTDGAQGGSSTSFSPEHYSTEAPAFKCQHGHCVDRKLGDFAKWLRSQGCAPCWGDDDIDAAASLAAALKGLTS
jgi:hypothetical protein